MHTALYRGNAVFTVASTTLGVLCILATVTDVIRPTSPQIAQPNIVLEGLQKEGASERAYLSFNLTADLSSLFSWNTKQAFMYMLAEWQTPSHGVNQAVIWSHIAETARASQLHLPNLHVQYPYTLTDRGTNLRGTKFNITVAWETIPYAGALFAARQTFTGFSFPEQRIALHPSKPGRQWS